MVAVSVIVAVSDPVAGLQGLVRSIDAQTLRASEFEVVIADASTDGTGARLRDLAARRPNVVVHAADGGTSVAELLVIARDAARGGLVVELAPQRRLASRALELLLDRARQSGADAVLGRVAGAGASGLPDDTDRADASAIRLDRVLALVPKGADPRDLAGASVAVLRRSAVAVEDAGSPADEPGIAAAIRWSGGTLHVEPDLPAPGPDRRALVLRRAGTDVEVPIDRSGAAVLDPAEMEPAGLLENGLHDLAVRIETADRETISPLLAPSSPSAAVIAGRPFVVRAGPHGAQLDVGATRGAVTGPAPRSTVTITESVHGILLTLDQPSIHVRGDAQLDARLLLDSFPLRARLVCRDGVARVEAYASSLAGVSRLALAVGGGDPVPTGLRLRVDGTGVIHVEPVPAPRPAAPTPQAGPAPLVQRVRRRSPAPLEPAVRRLSKVPVLRRAYRALLTR